MYSMHFQSTNKARKEILRVYIIFYYIKAFMIKCSGILGTVKGVGQEYATMHGLKYIDTGQQ